MAFLPGFAYLPWSIGSINSFRSHLLAHVESPAVTGLGPERVGGAALQVDRLGHLTIRPEGRREELHRRRHVARGHHLPARVHRELRRTDVLQERGHTSWLVIIGSKMGIHCTSRQIRNK